MRGRLAPIGVHVHMSVDHAGQHRHGAEVDHLGALWNLQIGAHVGDVIAFDQHHLVGQHVAQFGIE